MKPALYICRPPCMPVVWSFKRRSLVLILHCSTVRQCVTHTWTYETFSDYFSDANSSTLWLPWFNIPIFDQQATSGESCTCPSPPQSFHLLPSPSLSSPVLPSPPQSFPLLPILFLQVLCCMYPIAQVREPFTIVGYLAQRVPLVEILKLKPEEYEPKKEGKEKATTTHLWTAWDICDGMYVWWQCVDVITPSSNQLGLSSVATSQLKQLDLTLTEQVSTLIHLHHTTLCVNMFLSPLLTPQNKANSILRLATDGKISMYFRPPGFSHEKGAIEHYCHVMHHVTMWLLFSLAMWASHPEVQEIIELQRLGLPPSVKEATARIQEDPADATFIALGNKFSLLMDLDC